MVALTGRWWLEVRKPRKETVAAHLVNLAWNGLSHLEAGPGLITAQRWGRSAAAGWQRRRELVLRRARWRPDPVVEAGGEQDSPNSKDTTTVDIEKFRKFAEVCSTVIIRMPVTRKTTPAVRFM